MKKLSLLALCLLALGLPARADTIYSNLGPGDSFQSGAAYGIGGNLSGRNDVAMPFTTGVQSYLLTQIEIAGFLVSGNGLFEAALYSSSGGHPGTPLAAIVRAIFQDPPALLSFSGFTASLDAGTTYWVVLRAADPFSSDGQLGWMWNATGVSGNVGVSSDGATWLIIGGTQPDPALRVSGTAIASTAPEPGALFLSLSGTLVLVTLNLKRRKLR